MNPQLRIHVDYSQLYLLTGALYLYRWFIVQPVSRSFIRSEVLYAKCLKLLQGTHRSASLRKSTRLWTQNTRHCHPNRISNTNALMMTWSSEENWNHNIVPEVWSNREVRPWFPDSRIYNSHWAPAWKNPGSQFGSVHLWELKTERNINLHYVQESINSRTREEQTNLMRSFLPYFSFFSPLPSALAFSHDLSSS